MCHKLGRRLDFVSFSLSQGIIKLVQQSKKIISQLGCSTMTTLLESTSFNFKSFQMFCELVLTEKSAVLRGSCIEFLSIQLKVASSSDDLLSYVDVALLEKVVKAGLQDANAQARDNCKKLYNLYKELWPPKEKVFFDSLDISTKKMIERALSSAASGQANTKLSIRNAISANVKKFPKFQDSATQEMEIEIFAPPAPPVTNEKRKSVSEIVIIADSGSANNDKKQQDASVEPREVVAEPKILSPDVSFSHYNNDQSFVNMVDSPSFAQNISFISNTDGSHRASRDGRTTPNNAASPHNSFLESKSGRSSLGGLTSTPLKSALKTTPKYQESKYQPSMITEEHFVVPSVTNKHTPAMKRNQKYNTSTVTQIGVVHETLADFSSPAPAAVVQGQEPKNGLLRMQEVIKCLQNKRLSEKLFRRIYRYARNFSETPWEETQKPFDVNLKYSIQMAICYKQYFDSLLNCYLNLLSDGGPISQKENCLLVLKHSIEFHPQLFDKNTHYEKLFDLLFKLESHGETNIGEEIGIVTAAKECLVECIAYFDLDSVVTLLLKRIESGNPGDAEAGVYFRSLATLVDRRFSAEQNQGQLETQLLTPLFQSGQIKKYLSSSNVLTRKSVFDFLISAWKVLGDKFESSFLCRVNSDEPLAFKTITKKAENSKASGHSGLSLPNYKLFQLLIEKEKQKLT